MLLKVLGDAVVDLVEKAYRQPLCSMGDCATLARNRSAAADAPLKPRARLVPMPKGGAQDSLACFVPDGDDHRPLKPIPSTTLGAMPARPAWAPISISGHGPEPVDGYTGKVDLGSERALSAPGRR